METTTKFTDSELQNICNIIDKAFYTNEINSVSYITLDRQQLRIRGFYCNITLDVTLFLSSINGLEINLLKYKEDLPTLEEVINDKVKDYSLFFKFMAKKGYTKPSEMTDEDRVKLTKIRIKEFEKKNK